MDQITNLQNQIDDLKDALDLLYSSSTFPLDVQRALVSRGLVKLPNKKTVGPIKALGNGDVDIVTGLTGTVFVASLSGGAVTLPLTVTNGIITS